MENKNKSKNYVVNSACHALKATYPSLEITRKQVYNFFRSTLNQSPEGWGMYSAPIILNWVPYTKDIEMLECIDVSLQLDHRLLWFDSLLVIRRNSLIVGNSPISEDSKLESLLLLIETKDIPLIFIQIGHFYLINSPRKLVSTLPGGLEGFASLVGSWLESRSIRTYVDENASKLRSHMREECAEFIASFTQPLNFRGEIDSSMRDEMADMLFYNPSFRKACADSAVLQNILKNSISGDRRLFTKSKGLTNEVRPVVIESELNVPWSTVSEVIKDSVSKLRFRDPDFNYKVDVQHEHNIIVLRLTSIKDGLVISTVRITRYRHHSIGVRSESYHFVGGRGSQNYDFFTVGQDFNNLNRIVPVKLTEEV